MEDALKTRGEMLPEPVVIQAMVDTGATGTVIRKDIPEKLGIYPVGQQEIATATQERIRSETYMVRLVLPNRVVVEVKAIAAEMPGQPIQCLIGRDVLAHGVLIYIGYVNSFTLSF